MANHPVADRVKHLSVRIDDDDMLRIDKIRDKLSKSNGGITLHRSQVLRRVISLGLESYGSTLGIDMSSVATAPVVKKSEKSETKKAESKNGSSKKAKSS